MVSPINQSKKVKKYSTVGFKLYNRVAITITLAIFIYFYIFFIFRKYC